jgi:histidine triad (HIT) family protein
MRNIVLVFSLLFTYPSFAQSEVYKQRKAKQLSEKSPFQDEIDGKFPEHILYQDKEVIAFKSNSAQLPVHILIIPKRRIPTLNDVGEKDSKILGKMLLVAKKLAKDLGISESGYRLVINTNEDAGQSVFHIHLHLLGGRKTGAMVEQTWRNQSEKPSNSYLKDIEDVRYAFGQYYSAWLKNDEMAVLQTLTNTTVIMPQGLTPKKGIEEIRNFWFPKDGSKTTITKFDYIIEDLKVDLNTAFIRSSSVLSFEYEKDGQKITKNDQKQVHITYMERQTDGAWKVTCKMWSSVN